MGFIALKDKMNGLLTQIGFKKHTGVGPNSGSFFHAAPLLMEPPALPGPRARHESVDGRGDKSRKETITFQKRAIHFRGQESRFVRRPPLWCYRMKTLIVPEACAASC